MKVVSFITCVASQRQPPAIRIGCATKLLALLLLLLLLTLPAVVQAQFTYTTNNGAITITKYTGSGGAVTIPNTTNGLPVTSIGDYAFARTTSLTSVTIPGSVTHIGTRAFAVCFSLTAIIMAPANSYYSSLNGTLFNANQTTLIQCPGGIVGTYTIPGSVTQIGDAALAGCFGLTAIAVNATNASFRSVDGVLFNTNQATLVQCPGGRAGSYAITNTVTNIGDSAFGGCISLTNITIPASVTRIGNEAFSDCTGLTNISIPGSVTNFGSGAFAGCSGLISVTISNGVTNIGNWAFNSCTNLTSIPIPGSVTSIGDGAFERTRLTSIMIPASVTSIGDEAFFYCTRLSNVTIGESVTNIGSSAFAACTSLRGVYFQGNAPSADSTVFANDNNPTVYYLPGTTGWGETFSGRPTVLWNPQVQTSGATFGVRTNRFGFTITGSSNLVIVVEACTDLANPTWSPVATNTLTSGSSYFSDPQWTKYPARLYRIRSP